MINTDYRKYPVCDNIYFLVTVVTSALAGRPVSVDILDAYVSSLRDSRDTSNSDACVDFYSFTCKKINNKNLHRSKYNHHLAELYTSQVYNVLVDSNFFKNYVTQLLLYEKNMFQYYAAGLFYFNYPRTSKSPILFKLDILRGEIKTEDEPIDKERKLFQNCMKLGSEENSVDNDDATNDKLDNNNISEETFFGRLLITLFAIDAKSEENEDYSKYTTDYMFDEMMKQFDQNITEKNWQKLDQQLADLGFKHSFFEINVVKDPESPSQNIIRLSPPSMKEWNFKKVTDVISDIFTNNQLELFDSCNKAKTSDTDNTTDDPAQSNNDSAFLESNESENKDSESKESQYDNPICKKFAGEEREALRGEILDPSDNEVMTFLNNLLQGIFDAVDSSKKHTKVRKMTIDGWNIYGQTLSKKSETAMIDWYQVLKSYFEKLRIHVNPSDYILIDNVPYFTKLYNILKRSSNKVIAHTLRSKFVAENIRYFDWNWANEMNPVNRQSFCVGHNKFYAASAEVLKHLKSKMKPYDKKVETLLYQIAGAFHANISNAMVSEMEKNYLLSNLKDVTKYPFRIHDDSTIASYYKEFEITGDYLVDINRYNRLMREINLRKYHSAAITLHRSTPFSILDTDNPRNRYIIHSALNAIIYKERFLHNKATVYGSLGVRSAGFLFSLLKETTFKNDLRSLEGVSAITPQVSYDPEKVSCFIRENVVKYGYPVNYNIITEVFSVRFAYEAMLIHLKGELTEEFFTAYTEDHCGEQDSRMAKKVLSNVVEFSTAFGCSNNDNTACKLQAF